MFLNSTPGVMNAPTMSTPPVSRPVALLIALALLAPFALYFGTVEAIVSIWNSSETFAHGYVILPISLWLVWRRRENFSLYPPQPWLPALLLLAVLGAAWLAARLGEVQVVSQYAFAAMLPVTALAMFGPRLAGSLAFPLMFVLFAVPFGDVFVAPLIQFTADFTVAAVRATGIPVLRSGTHFELPTGNWSVVEACSGVRYLISSITLGCLYAYLTFRTPLRRALFIGLAIVVPIVANGLRAYMIVMIGHLSGMELATGVDHLIYGWLFFGLVMFIMFWIGSYWREDTAGPTVPAAASTASASAKVPSAAAAARTGRVAAMVAAVLAVAAVWPVLALVGDRVNHNPAQPVLADIPVNLPPAAEFTDWQPAYKQPDARYHRVYAVGGVPVGLTVLYYRNQTRDKSLISSVNRLAGYEDAWHEIDGAMRSATLGTRPLALREAVLTASHGKIVVWTFIWSGGHYTASNITGKLWQAASKAMLHGDDGAAVMLAAPADKPEQARAALRAFLLDQGAALDRALSTERAR
jgi:exosortase A